MSSPIDRGAYRSKNEWTCAHCHKKFPETAPLYRVKYKHYRRKFGDFVCYECAVGLVKQFDIGGKCVRDIAQFPKHLQIRQVPWR